LKRESQILYSGGVGLAVWREIAIAISRKYMRGAQRFTYDNDDEDGDGEEDAIEDLQAGYGSYIAGMIYTRGIREKDGEVIYKKALFR
jgi:hypothetical protein